MNSKIILDIKSSTNSNFILNLKDIDFLTSVHLSLPELINECYEAVERDDFNVAEDMLKLAIRLSSYGNCDVDRLKDTVYGRKIIYEYNNKRSSNISFYIDILSNIKLLFSIIDTQYNLENDEKVNNIVKAIKDIEKEIDLDKLVEEAINDVNNVSITIKDLEKLEKFIEEAYDNNLKKRLITLSELYIKNINNNIRELSNCRPNEVITRMALILRDKYDRQFITSIELENILFNNKYKEFENYNTLLEFTDKAYLVYKFNNSKKLSQRVKVLYTETLPQYLELPMMYKDHVCEQLINYKNKYIDINEFFIMLDKIINNIKLQMSNKAIPL